MEGTSSMVVNEEDDLMDLPPGFRFHPTDEEIITHYLTNKMMDQRFTTLAIGEVDMNKCEPWDLPKKSKMKEKEWYFFCQRDRKYPTGMRTNRATGTGYWKATGKDREIYKMKGCLIGMKKTLVFYKGRAPKGEKTNWVMHEYRLEGRISYYNFPRGTKDEWVVCKIYHKNTGVIRDVFAEFARNDSFMKEILGSPSSLPPLMDDIDKPSYEEFNGGSSSQKSSTNNNAIFPSSNSYLQNNNIQENQINNFFIPTYPNPFKASYQALNAIQENPFNYQQQEYSTTTTTNSFAAAAANQQFSSNNSMVSPISQQDTAEINSSNNDVVVGGTSKRDFEDIEGLSNTHNMSELESLWDY